MARLLCVCELGCQKNVIKCLYLCQSFSNLTKVQFWYKSELISIFMFVYSVKLYTVNYRSKKFVYSHITVSFALARIAEFNLAGPTWHWYSASSSSEAFDIRKLYTPCVRSPNTENLGYPVITLVENPVSRENVFFYLFFFLPSSGP